ncbi:MAG: heme-binding domain-containing protein [Bdellovibrionia bacterium]
MIRVLVMHILIIFLAFSEVVFAHKGHQHRESESSSHNESNVSSRKKLSDLYKQKARPIFSKKCMDCHSSTTNYPWYYPLPGIKHYIDNDIAEAKKHLDMSNGYPFKSHATPIEDLEAIKEVIQDETMPPLRYRLLHRKSKLSPDEKKIILEWTNEAGNLLKRR